jgi:RNA recognition motif-containing protein
LHLLLESTFQSTYLCKKRIQMDIHVSNIPFKVTEEELTALFKEFGQVDSATIIIDHKTRQNKGFGFVKMYKDSEAKKAIAALNGKMLLDRRLRVTPSTTKEEVKDPEKKIPYWKRAVKKKTRIVTFDNQPQQPKKGTHKKRRGHGRGTTY